MSAFGGKADIAYCGGNVGFWPKAGIRWPRTRPLPACWFEPL